LKMPKGHEFGGGGWSSEKRGRAGRRPAAEDNRAADAPSDTTPVTVRTARKDIWTFTSPMLAADASRWSHIVGNRRRWADSKTASDDLADQSRNDLIKYGFTPEHLQQVADADLVEVSVPYQTEERGWEGRVFPWEYILTAATRSLRQEKPLTVVRHLKKNGPPPRARPLEKLLLVVSAPGEVEAAYSFDSELALLRSKLSNLETKDSPDPTAEELQEDIEDFQPDVVHLAGCDVWEASDLLELPPDPARVDGYMLQTADGRPHAVGAAALAKILNSGKQKPLLVACNFWNSAARTAALAVAEGAAAAVGFQDEFDSELGELFYGVFYNVLRLSGGDILLAYREGCAEVRSMTKGLLRSGMVLWSARSIREAPREETPRRRRRATSEAPQLPLTAQSAGAAPPGGLREALERGKRVEVQLKGQNPCDLLLADIRPYTELNYSMLHNKGGLFERFTLKNCAKEGVMRDVELEVQLHLGADSAPWRMKTDLVQPVENFSDRIKAPLTSTLGRGLRESVRTTLYVLVRWQNQDVVRQTHPVTLLAVDEWKDDELNRIWLPSFVLSRDPQVAKIIDAAHRYLMVLEDDSTAAFVGYESSAENADERAEEVDLQVQAVWFSLLHDLPLGYINPPPTFAMASQRLRTPTDILRGRRGTCIDLTLLLAACLEYLDIYPVLFLLKGHAFPGYWRSREAYQAFVQARTAAPAPGGRTAGQTWRWYLDKNFYGEVQDAVRRGALVPIESVWLTHRGSFWEAVDEGVKNLRDREEFDALIDVKLAREEEVTPLPLLQREIPT
jgi:hypothetical protein